MYQFTPDVIQDRDKEFAWRKAKTTHEMRLEANNVRLVDRQEVQGSWGTEQHS
jgi:hypothetical protein